MHISILDLLISAEKSLGQKSAQDLLFMCLYRGTIFTINYLLAAISFHKT